MTPQATPAGTSVEGMDGQAADGGAPAPIVFHGLQGEVHASEATTPTPEWVGTAFAGGAALLAVVITGALIMRRRWRNSGSPEALAARRLCQSLRVSRAERRVLEALSRFQDAGEGTLAAMLISPHAFSRACERASRAGELPDDPKSIERLTRRLAR